MFLTRILMVLVLVISSVSIAQAGPLTDKLNECFADNTSGKDRKQFARWVFIAMVAHPEINEIASGAAEAKESVSKEVGQMVTRLLTEDCASEAILAVRVEGRASFQSAFGVLGQLATKELLGAPEVNAVIGGFDSYLDRERIQKVFSAK